MTSPRCRPSRPFPSRMRLRAATRRLRWRKRPLMVSGLADRALDVARFKVAPERVYLPGHILEEATTTARTRSSSSIKRATMPGRSNTGVSGSGSAAGQPSPVLPRRPSADAFVDLAASSPGSHLASCVGQCLRRDRLGDVVIHPRLQAPLPVALPWHGPSWRRWGCCGCGPPTADPVYGPWPRGRPSSASARP